MRWLAVLVAALPGCVELEPTSVALVPLETAVLAQLREGAQDWEPLACDPTQARTHGSDAWWAYRTSMARLDGRYVALALGDATTGDGRPVAVDGPDMPIFGEDFTLWATDAGALLVQDGRILYLWERESVTPEDVAWLANQAVDGLGIDVGARNGEGTPEVILTAPGHDAEGAFGWLRVGPREHWVAFDDDGQHRTAIELDLRPWPTKDAHWIAPEAAIAIATAHLRCMQTAGVVPRGLERPEPTSARQDFHAGELVWSVGTRLQWRDDRDVDCTAAKTTLPYSVGVLVDARTGAVVRQWATADGEGPCYVV